MRKLKVDKIFNELKPKSFIWIIKNKDIIKVRIDSIYRKDNTMLVKYHLNGINKYFILNENQKKQQFIKNNELIICSNEFIIKNYNELSN